MKWLIRFIGKGAGGTAEFHDKILTAEQLTIGRATDQALHLRDRRVRLQHARLEAEDGKVSLVGLSLAGVTVNGRSEREVELAAGDVIEVGANVLKVIDAPSGVDFALSFELADNASSEHLAPAWTATPAGILGFSKRRLAWFAVAAVLLFALLLPSLTLIGGKTAGIMRDLPLPDDGLWLAGPVHEKHAAISLDCGACHQQPFRRVPDNACTACHETGRHVGDAAMHVLGDTRCAACHLEHNEPPALVQEHQGLCAGCHRDGPPGSDLPGAADFLDAHPPFRVSLLTPKPAAAGLEWVSERLPLVEAATAERSNLKFDHALHLADDGINAPDGRRVLDCADCHVAETGGARMRPVRMDDHCSGCHTLSFDPADPSRTVPHGDLEGVLQTLTEYYSARLLGDDSSAPAQRLRRPGQALTREDRDRVAGEARAQALQVATDLVERRACVNCHEVTRMPEDSDLPWRVQPVRLTERFFPLARFSHAAHSTEVTSCAACHAAADSEQAADLLMPTMQTCRDCHGSGNASRNGSAQTASSCILCHGFHDSDKGLYP